MNCVHCGHDSSEHEHKLGPCNVKHSDGTHCICYRFGQTPPLTEQYDTVLAENIAYWKARAEEKRRAGLVAVAISFDNIAWLLEHQMSWLAYQESQSTHPN